MTTISNPCKPIMDSFEFVEDWKVSTGTRVYVSCDISDPLVQNLPAIGSIWSQGNVSISLKRRKGSYTANNPACPFKWTCFYDSSPMSEMHETTQPADLPVAIDLAVQTNTYDNPYSASGNYWSWSDDSGASRIANIRFVKDSRMETMIIQRYIYGDNIGPYNALAINMVGKINGPTQGSGLSTTGSGSTFLSFAVDKVKFDGASIDEVVGSNNGRKWLAKMKFSIMLDGTWNQIYDPVTNTFRKPIFGGDSTATLYQEIDFTPLFTFGQAPIAPDPVFPRS